MKTHCLNKETYFISRAGQVDIGISARYKIKILVTLFILLFFNSVVYCQSLFSLLSSFPENWETRSEKLTLLLGDLEDSDFSPGEWKGEYTQILNNKKVYYGSYFEQDSLIIYFRFSPPVSFEYNNQGDVIIVKNEEEQYKHMLIYLEDGNESYIKVEPYQERTKLQIVLFDIIFYEDIILSLPFKEVILSPFSKIVQLSENRIMWEQILYRGMENEHLIQIVEKIRSELKYFTFEEDAAFNEDGMPVTIGTNMPSSGGVNCSGFVKWVVDGFYYPYKKTYISIEKLIQKHLDSRGSDWTDWYEEARDPYFGLDWSRNLAIVLEEARTNRIIADPEIFDVRNIEPFDYIDDVGFPVSYLPIILFFLSQQKMDSIYIGSINKDFGPEPEMRQHVHLVILIPIYHSNSKFEIVVFESGAETSIKNLQNNHLNSYIHLVEINARGEFAPLNMINIISK